MFADDIVICGENKEQVKELGKVEVHTWKKRNESQRKTEFVSEWDVEVLLGRKEIIRGTCPEEGQREC